MNSANSVIKDLKRRGFKVTEVRTAMVDLLLSGSKPISVPEILASFKNLNLSVNKTTIYRELNFLLELGLIQQVDLRERGKKYEYNHSSHHHHLICLKCKEIEDFDLEQDLDMTEKKIKQVKNFTVLNHSLEFFGTCKNCSIK